MKIKSFITKLSFVVIIVASFSSCVSTNKGFQSSPVIARNVELDPIKADIKVNTKQKLKGRSSSSYLFYFLRLRGDNTFADGIIYSSAGGFNPMKIISAARLGNVRAAAAYKALEGKDYDVLVHPTYTVTTKGYFFYSGI